MNYFMINLHENYVAEMGFSLWPQDLQSDAELWNNKNFNIQYFNTVYLTFTTL